MTVDRIMSKNTICTNPGVSVADARSIMQREGIGRLPVLDKNNNLVGIVTELDIINASPSSASTLDIYEMGQLLSKLKVEKVMKKNVLTVTESTMVEEAARIMADNHISGLPVMRNGKVVGIVTERDLFRFFIDIFGARSLGTRVTFYLREQPGELAKISKIIADNGGNIITFVTCPGSDVANKLCMVKIAGIKPERIREILALPDLDIVDVVQC